ncbi:PepSY-associated TM helix domain-containing protein [Urechidicola croceus]|uniref:Peptidase n=1 Tax=Urechidicola croceus TaxID=1850246 RepID=A0A1D8P6C0_9FLAO|nr:PepSY-associated TM helix domain-containing protein [Urechidicola croceus]AOW20120.1 hypothetical protein LPB138_05240 [Urechidicola croceus]
MRLLNALLRKKRKKESWLKYIMSVLHLWLGLLSSIVIFIVCITGSIYTFKNKIIDAYNYDKVYVSEEDKPFLSLDKIRYIFKNKNLEITQITIPDTPNKSLHVSYKNLKTKNSGSYYVNPYSGKIIGSGDYSLENFFSIVLSLHRSLLIDNVGKQIVGVSILIFVFMLFSGLILWWPNKLKQIKQGLKVKWKAKFRRVNYDLHNVFGFYFLLPLLFISITGLYVSYPWVKSAIIVSLGGTPVLTAQASEETKAELSNAFNDILKEMVEKENEKSTLKEVKPVSIDSIIHLADMKLNYIGITTVKMPNEKDPRFTIKKINRENWLKALLPDIISFNKKGEIKRVELFKNKPLSKQFIEISLPLHTGEIMGWPSLIFYFIATLIGCSLPITGFLIWWGKYKKTT